CTLVATPIRRAPSGAAASPDVAGGASVAVGSSLSVTTVVGLASPAPLDVSPDVSSDVADGAAVAEGALVASPPSLSSSPPHAASTSANAAAAAQRRVRRPRFTRAVLLVLTGTPSPRARPGRPSTHLLKTVEIFALDCKHELVGSARMRFD